MAVPPLGIERVGDSECVGVQLEDRVDLGAAGIDLRDAIDVRLRQLA